jgi:transcriptional regulator with GAF, ATPase, and Fis domain
MMNSVAQDIDDPRVFHSNDSVTAFASEMTSLVIARDSQHVGDPRRGDQTFNRRTAQRGAMTASQTESAIVYRSEAIRSVLTQVHHVAPTGSTVLLLGETGVGKELFAQAIHDASPRRHRPMIRVSCAALPATLIESELFGHERGAFTNAVSRRIGRFEAANGSTLFLDEIGELSQEMQVKLLRVLEERTIERLGGHESIKVDVRIIAATNRDLEEAMTKGAFREDLFFRLNVFPITIPALRERKEDIDALVWAFVEEMSHTFGKRIETIASHSLSDLKRYPWPGNVRELRNVIERALILATNPTLTPTVPCVPSAPSSTRSTRLIDVQTRHITSVLESCGWRIRGIGGAAEQLGLRPTTLETRMAKLGISRPQYRLTAVK